MTTLLGCAIGDDLAEARQRLKPGVALYAGFFPRYNRLLAESGFEQAASGIRDAWQRGDRARAVALVPDALVDAVALAGPPELCRQRIAQYRDAGITLPIVTPRVRDGGGLAAVKEAIHACAPAG
jgi:alkanesulfonate monooxygenase SsuD/methylene tetrahydromethanopterin reductase-like flavin-dependent oxidoreductase (luciferase family)